MGTDDAVFHEAEDRRLGVLVGRDDRLGRLHTRAGGTEAVREGLGDREVVGAVDAAATGDDGRGLSPLG